MSHAQLLHWLSSPDNPPVRYLTARELVNPRPPAAELESLRAAALAWAPLRQSVHTYPRLRRPRTLREAPQQSFRHFGDSHWRGGRTRGDAKP